MTNQIVLITVALVVTTTTGIYAQSTSPTSESSAQSKLTTETDIITDAAQQPQRPVTYYKHPDSTTSRPARETDYEDPLAYAFMPSNYFRPIPFGGPFTPYGPFGPFVGYNPFLAQTINNRIHDSMRSSDQEFRKMETQAVEGSISKYIHRNGVTYLQTCTTRKV